MCMHVKTGKSFLKFVLSTASMAQYHFVDTKSVHYRKKSEHYRGNFFGQITMLLKFSRGFKDIITKTVKFKEFPGLENKFQNSRGFKEIKDTWEHCSEECTSKDSLFLLPCYQYHDQVAGPRPFPVT